MNNQRKAIAVAAAIGLTATFLPWAVVPSAGSVSGTEGDGWISFAIFAAIIALALVGQRAARLQGVKLYVTVALALAASGIGVWKIIDLQSAINALNDLTEAFGEAFGASLSISVGIGLYLLVLMGIVTAAVALVVKDKQTVAPIPPQTPVAPPTTPLPPQTPPASPIV